MTVFADTFAFIAWLSTGDASHSAVVNYLEKFAGRLVTTEWVLMEVADALASPQTRAIAIEFLLAVRADAMFEVVPYSRETYDDGFTLYANRSDKAWSLTDCISFAVMAKRGLTDALTADHHFEQAGFRAVFGKN